MDHDADDTSARPTSRRAVLGGLAAGLGIVLVGPAKQATAAGAVVSVGPPPGGLTSVATSARSIVRLPTVLGAELKVSTRPVRAGSTISVGFDERLYRAGAPRLTTVAGQALPCRSSKPSRGSKPASATARLTLEQDLLPGETYVLSLGTRQLVRYPHDIVAGPLPIQVVVDDLATGSSSTRLAASPAVDHPVWGLSVGVGWQAVYWGDGYHSWTPEVVTVASTGPADVPAGTIVASTLDARLFGRARFLPLGDDAVPGPDGTDGDGVISTRWTMPHALPAGRRVSVRLLVDAVEPGGPLIDLHPPTATARGARGAIGQRLTRQESATRGDSAHDDATRLTYGLDLVTPLRPR